MHLVGFIIRIYHDARSPERQIYIYIYIHTNTHTHTYTYSSQYVEAGKAKNNNNKKKKRKIWTALNATCQRDISAFHFGRACHKFVSPNPEAFHDVETLILRFCLILVYTLNISTFIL